MKIFILLLLIFLNLCNTLYAEEYNAKKICDIIYIIEGKEKANQPYGINPKYITCKSKNECEQICHNTVNNNKIRFKNQNKEKDFLSFLAKRYCPLNWKVWLKNLKFYLNKGEYYVIKRKTN